MHRRNRRFVPPGQVDRGRQRARALLRARFPGPRRRARAARASRGRRSARAKKRHARAPSCRRSGRQAGARRAAVARRADSPPSALRAAARLDDRERRDAQPLRACRRRVRPRLTVHRAATRSRARAQAGRGRARCTGVGAGAPSPPTSCDRHRPRGASSARRLPRAAVTTAGISFDAPPGRAALARRSRRQSERLPSRLDALAPAARRGPDAKIGAHGGVPLVSSPRRVLLRLAGGARWRAAGLRRHPSHASEGVEAEADGEFEHLVGVLEGREDDGGVVAFINSLEACLTRKSRRVASRSCALREVARGAEHEKHDRGPFVDLAVFSSLVCHHVDR